MNVKESERNVLPFLKNKRKVWLSDGQMGMTLKMKGILNLPFMSLP